MKNKALSLGKIAVISPVPMFILTAFWFWGLFFGIGMSLLNYDTVPEWITICGLLPWFVSPCIGVCGIVCGCIGIKKKRAWLGILLSALGLVENFLLLCGIVYLGSRY